MVPTADKAMGDGGVVTEVETESPEERAASELPLQYVGKFGTSL